MQLTIANNKALLTDDVSVVIFAQSQVPITINSAIPIGTSIVLMTATGKTLAMTSTSDGTTATLDTNTVECYEYVQSLTVNATKGAYLVIGSTDSVIAVADVQLAKNPIADIAPPTESAPVYPTHEELLAILARMQETQRNVILAERNVGELVANFDGTIADGVAQVNEASQQATDAIAQKVAEGETAIGDATSQGVASVETASEGALSDIDAKVTEAETTINAKVAEAETHATNASASASQANVFTGLASQYATQSNVYANQASASATQAKEALNNGCVYTPIDLGFSSIIPLMRETTIYKIDILGESTIAFNLPTLEDGEVIVFWLWITMGDTAYPVTFPSNVAWISEPSLGANTQCMLAFMSVDNGASWKANVQWEV